MPGLDRPSVAGEIRETDCFRACRRPELGIGLDVATAPLAAFPVTLGAEEQRDVSPARGAKPVCNPASAMALRIADSYSSSVVMVCRHPILRCLQRLFVSSRRASVRTARRRTDRAACSARPAAGHRSRSGERHVSIPSSLSALIQRAAMMLNTASRPHIGHAIPRRQAEESVGPAGCSRNTPRTPAPGIASQIDEIVRSPDRRIVRNQDARIQGRDDAATAAEHRNTGRQELREPAR